MRIGVWSPLPPSQSGIADYAFEQLKPLSERFEVVAVDKEPDARPVVDLDLYHLGNSPAHSFVYRAALARPGVVLLHDFSLHHLVLGETVERGDVGAYLREMRRSYGEAGTFVGRQVARALGGDLLPALFPLNERVLEGSLAIVGLTEHVCSRARQGLPGRPVLHLPHHVFLPGRVQTRSEARKSLGISETAFLVTAPGLATRSKGLEAATGAVARLANRCDARLMVAGAKEEGLPLELWAERSGIGERVVVTGRLSLDSFVSHLAAADVILALRFPTHGEISGALLRSLGVGRAALVTAGTPAAEEFPEGVVVPVDPGPLEKEELHAFLERLEGDPGLREGIEERARAYVQRVHGLEATVATLGGFLEGVLREKDALLAALEASSAEEGSLRAYLLDEVRRAALDLSLRSYDFGHQERVLELLGARK